MSRTRHRSTTRLICQRPYPWRGERNSWRNRVTIDNTSVTASGDYVHGIVAASEITEVELLPGASVTTDGVGAAGIVVRPYSDPSFTTSRDDIVGIDATITVAAGASVTSDRGVGILDDGRAAYVEYDDTTLTFVQGLREVANRTSVDIAGTVTGGGGTAIDLGDDADSLYLRAGAVVTGSITLGDGNDRFQFEDTYVFTSMVDGGGGEDAVVADIGASQTRTLDIGTLSGSSITSFEVIEKDGEGEPSSTARRCRRPIVSRQGRAHHHRP